MGIVKSLDKEVAYVPMLGKGGGGRCWNPECEGTRERALQFVGLEDFGIIEAQRGICSQKRISKATELQ